MFGLVYYIINSYIIQVRYHIPRNLKTIKYPKFDQHDPHHLFILQFCVNNKNGNGPAEAIYISDTGSYGTKVM